MEMAHPSNVIIHGSTFNSAQGDIHINNSESGLHTLRQGVSLGAIHDSAERYPPPNCHPNTRKAVQKIILDWIHSENSASSFFWLYGPAGAGKTAILQAITELLCSPSESCQNFGGSFFFSRGEQRRDQGHFLFSTIAYQLALKVPGLRQHVNRIMELNPTLHTKSMDVQLQSLIVDAFQCLSPLPQRSYLVIIDGLDECHDKTTQQMILRLLCETITVHKLPLQFLIGSRPESHICAKFDQESLYTITHRVVLDGTFNPGRDIQVVLQDGFAKICAESSIMSHVEQPWPREGIIDLLVQRSSGQFIYAATVLKFVGADYCSPTKQLALVLKTDPTAFSDLDQLYTQILSVYPTAVYIVQVLGIISVSHGDLAEVMEDIFGMEEGELKQALRGLSSLMKDENDETGARLYLRVISNVIPHFAHASFSDYLFNSSRSGSFHVNREEYENQVTIRSFALIMQSIRSWKISSVTPVLHTTTWNYFISCLPARFSRSPQVVKEAIMSDIDDIVREFRRSSSDVGASFFAMFRLLEVLEGCSNVLRMSANSNSSDHSAYSAQSDRIGAKSKILFDRLELPAIPNSWDYSAQLWSDRTKFEILIDGYRKMLDQSLSKSKDLGDMLRFLPGIVVQKHMSMQGVAELYRIKPDLLERFIKFTTASESPSRHILNDYLRGFLRDRDRSQLYYRDPILQHISICRHILSLLDQSNAFDFLHHYVYYNFYGHLCAATSAFLHAQTIFDDHPAIELLHDLEATAYYIDNNSSGYNTIQSIIKSILTWANMLDLNYRLKDVAVSVDLMERVCHLTNKVYREIFCITGHGGMMKITLPGFDRIQVSDFSWTPQCRIVLSWVLLDWITIEGRIPCSFTNFITTPELSGPLYISSDIYHTQITEYSLQKFIIQHSPGQRVISSLDPVWSLRDHLSRALPTEKIFYQLRSISLKHVISDYPPNLMLDALEIIIQWLHGLGSERPSDLYDRFQGDLHRHKALSFNSDSLVLIPFNLALDYRDITNPKHY